MRGNTIDICETYQSLKEPVFKPTTNSVSIHFNYILTHTFNLEKILNVGPLSIVAGKIQNPDNFHIL